MRREDLVEVFKRVPEVDHPQLNLVLRNQVMLTIDAVARYEPTYLVFRGREGGSTDEGRGFFVPYEDISYIRLERVVRTTELKRMYGESVEDRNGPTDEAAPAEAAKAVAVDTPTPPPAPAAPMDPASIAKQNLLERIRAARVTATGGLNKPAAK